MRIKAGSLQPRMVIGLTENGAPLEGLDTASSVVMVAVRGATEVIRDENPIVNVEDGSVAHQWEGDETAVRGRLYWTVEVDLGAGVVIFPPYGEEVTDIE